MRSLDTPPMDVEAVRHADVVRRTRWPTPAGGLDATTAIRTGTWHCGA